MRWRNHSASGSGKHERLLPCRFAGRCPLGFISAEGQRQKVFCPELAFAKPPAGEASSAAGAERKPLLSLEKYSAGPVYSFSGLPSLCHAAVRFVVQARRFAGIYPLPVGFLPAASHSGGLHSTGLLGNPAGYSSKKECDCRGNYGGPSGDLRFHRLF